VFNNKLQMSLRSLYSAQCERNRLKHKVLHTITSSTLTQCRPAVPKACHFEGLLPATVRDMVVRYMVKNRVTVRFSIRVSLAFNKYGFIVI